MFRTLPCVARICSVGARSGDISTKVFLLWVGNQRAMAPWPALGSIARSRGWMPAHSTIFRPSGSGVGK